MTTAGAFLGWTALFISATSTQRALMLSTLAWQDAEMVETDESSRRAFCKSARRLGEGGVQAPRVPIFSSSANQDARRMAPAHKEA